MWFSQTSLIRCGGVFAVLLAVAAICRHYRRRKTTTTTTRNNNSSSSSTATASASNGRHGSCENNSSSSSKPTTSSSASTGKPPKPKEKKWMPVTSVLCLGPWGMQQWGGLFALYALRIFIVPLWDLPYIPILSPLYGQGQVWLETHERTLAILLHVGSGSIALLCGARQFNRTLRHRKPALHRLLGRVYVFAGLTCVCSLFPLWGTMGRGTSKEPSKLVQSMTLVTNTFWVIATATAVRHAREGRFEQHRKVSR